MNDNFTINGNSIGLSMNDYWQWAYSDLRNSINRSVLAEYIVASSLELPTTTSESTRILWRPYDLLTSDGLRVEVKSSSYSSSHDGEKPDRINFRIAPARMPDEAGDYKDNAPLQRNSDVYIFCIYKALMADSSPLNLDLWEFYVLSTKILNEKVPTQKTITFPSLLNLEPFLCDYYGIGEAINQAMTV